MSDDEASGFSDSTLEGSSNSLFRSGVDETDGQMKRLTERSDERSFVFAWSSVRLGSKREHIPPRSLKHK